MELITSDQRDEVLRTATADAFHLELRDAYHVASEDDPFNRWRRGEQDDELWHEPWLQLVRELTANGRTVRRVRVVTEPHSDYIRWERAITAANQAAGEDIRWLRRHDVPDTVEWPEDGNDWWLIDGQTLAIGHFAPDGRPQGSEVTSEAARVDACRHVRDLVWSLAIPHDQYRPS